jgi:hypothetical protein
MPATVRALPVGALRPGWLTGGTIRFLILCGAIAAVSMLSPRLTPTQAGMVALVGGLATVAGASCLWVATRALAAQEGASGLTQGQRTAASLLGLLRATGLPLLGLAFFLVWSFVYVGMWWYAPSGIDRAFTGLAPRPRYADFFYYSVSTGLISPPGDIFAHSRGARAATVIEMLAGLALVTTYLSSFAVGRLAGVARRDDAPHPEADA